MRRESVEKKGMKGMLDSVSHNNRFHKDAGLKKVLGAMKKVDRKYFVLREDIHRAYLDFPLPIGYDQTISQPSTVARMLILGKIRKGMNLLEIGSGSGWNACLLAYLAYPGKVVSVERIPELADFAHGNFHRLKIKGWVKDMNLEFRKGSVFSKKDLAKEQFDLVIVTAAADSYLAEKLKAFNFKRLVFPTSDGFLEIWEKKGNKIERVHREARYAFVPLIEK